jgi:hypothetical protein|tara:strand:+ start:474 stop:590 length:117 start_codon:yes stop_codon:yes gene_type:complete
MSNQTENREKIEDISKEKYVLWRGQLFALLRENEVPFY